nr:hypothetical protein [Paraprevotella clara]
MNGLKYAVLSLAVLACFDGSAKRKNKKAKKAETVRVDTCSVDTFSYAMGMANTQGLKNYVTSSMNVDTAYMANFIEGFNASLSEAIQNRIAEHQKIRPEDERIKICGPFLGCPRLLRR